MQAREEGDSVPGRELDSVPGRVRDLAHCAEEAGAELELLQRHALIACLGDTVDAVEAVLVRGTPDTRAVDERVPGHV